MNDCIDPLLGLDPQDVLDQVLGRIDQEQTGLQPEDPMRRARILKAVPQHPVQLVPLPEGRVHQEIRPHRVRRPDGQRFMSASTLPETTSPSSPRVTGTPRYRPGPRPCSGQDHVV